jgi:transposase-like protein
MNIHKNARLTPLRREEMALSVIEGGFSKAHAARVHGVSAKIVARWVERYKAEGRAGMIDRSSRPAHMPQATRCVDHRAHHGAAAAPLDRQAHRP